MPFYRFLIHGRLAEGDAEFRGFYTHRWAWGITQDRAGDRALKLVAKDWRSGGSAGVHHGLPPILEIEEAQRIAPWQIWGAPNRGNTLYGDH